jgi:hypothetical protein
MKSISAYSRSTFILNSLKRICIAFIYIVAEIKSGFDIYEKILQENAGMQPSRQ